VKGGDYFLLSSPTTDYYVWFTLEGAGADPAVGGRSGIRVDLLQTDDANSVAAKVASAPRHLFGDTVSSALAAALATAEVNAAMGRIVAAPTAGSSGVVPAVLVTVGERTGASRDALVSALAAAGGLGAIVAARASLSGAAAGCQAEVGAGAAMAAAAGTELAGGTPAAAGHAAALALQGLLGLVCDPIGGLVEVPCVARNATGCAVAMAAIDLALAGVTFPVPFDEVAGAMASVGRSLPPSLRETALGGLAVTPTGQRCACGD
jgi:L-serine dehydratase